MSAIDDDRPLRSAFAHRYPMTLRWHDNDVYRHMNNVIHYSLFDTAVNRWLIEEGKLVVPDGPVIGLVVETGCRYFASVGYPDPVEIGLEVTRVGRTSLQYRLALFGLAVEAAAVCRYVHVYVDAANHRPVPLPDALRRAAEAAQIAGPA